MRNLVLSISILVTACSYDYSKLQGMAVAGGATGGGNVAGGAGGGGRAGAGGAAGGRAGTGGGGKAGAGGAAGSGNSTGGGGRAGAGGANGGSNAAGAGGTAGGTGGHAGAGGAKSLGSPCSTAADCASTFCADSVCCNNACGGACEVCDGVGTPGTCMAATAGTDPRGDCADQGAATCGTDGFCDGAGACRKYLAGATCQSGGCTGSTLTFAGRCDGTGTCVSAPTQSCAPFVCDSTGQCKTTCSSDADCTNGNFCVSGSCGLRPIGANCSADADCMSTHCAQGVCCASACVGTCQSCALTGSGGTCTPVPAGQYPNPRTQCTDTGAANCLTDGLCSGAGTCQLYAKGTQCSAGSCTGATGQPPSTCNGTGSCVAPGTTSCAPYICGTGACKMTCSSNTDCASPDICVGSACVPPVTLSVQLAERDLNATDPVVAPHFRVANSGTNTVTLSQITLRYWYTEEGADGTTPVTSIQQTASCDFAAVGCSNVTMSFVQVTPAVTGANFYFQVGFTTGAGTLAPGANTNDVQAHINKSDFSNYDEADDYSYLPTTAYTTTTKVTAYLNGSLVYGTEPQ